MKMQKIWLVCSSKGVEMTRDTLTKFLNKDWYDLRPLHNFFFTRDASMSMYNEVLIGRMANAVRRSRIR